MTFETFMEIVRGMSGMPPLGLSSWHAYADYCERYRADVQAEIERFLSTYIVHTGVDPSREDFESWSPKKRIAANHAAALAFREASIQGHATADQRQKMMCYTGFGGFRNIGVLPEGFPIEYIEASRRVADAYRRGSQPLDADLDIMGRVKDQYFSPVPATRAGWDLLTRALGGVPTKVLEPSAGIGRFASTAPPQARMTLVEFDPMMAKMLALIYPQHEVFSGPFEHWVRTQTEATYDAAIGNPPWIKRIAHLRAYDSPDIALNVDYFTLRTMSVLRPGGTLCTLIPASFLLGASHRPYRERLLKSCAFRGAALLPSELYPLVRETTSVLLLVTRRAYAVEKFDAREEAVIRGDFLSLPEAEASMLGGEWRASSRGRKDADDEGPPFLAGPVDYTRVKGVVISAFELEQRPEGKAGKTKKQKPEPVVREAVMPPPVVEAVEKAAEAIAEESLASRIRQWIVLTNTDPDEAERQRQSILNAVSLFLADYGVPQRPEIRAVLDGNVAGRILLTPVSNRPVFAAPKTDNIETATAWYCDRKGFATASDLADFGDDLQVARAAAQAGLYLTFTQDGVRVQTRPFYLHGSATMRLTEIDKASAIADPVLRRRLEGQKQEVLSIWQKKLLADIDFNPRSSFVPLEAVQDWLNSVALKDDVWDYRRAAMRVLQAQQPKGPDGKPVNTEFSAEELDAVPIFKLVSEFQQVQVAEDSPSRGYKDSIFKKARTLLMWLLGYLNRVHLVENDDGSRSRVKVSSDAEQQLKYDLEQEEAFRSWVSQSKWAAPIEEEYNRLTSSISVELPTSPIPIPGQTREISLRPHQNQAVRRACMGGVPRSLLCALDVGAGKTFTGIAIARKWVADGMARRVLIVAPASVLAKWEADARTLFPDARIGVIGISKGKDGKNKAATDPAPVRLAKWLAFAAGAYDIAIVSDSLFWLDVEADPQDAGDLISKLAWARRKAGEDVLEARRITRLLEIDEADLKEVEAEIADEMRQKEQYEGKGWWNSKRLDRATSKANNLRSKIEGYKTKLADLPQPTDSESTAVAEWVRATLQQKPYRPQVKEGAIVDPDNIDLPTAAEAEEEEEEGSDKEVEVKKVPSPGLVTWGELGIDGLIVDEAHNYRSTFYPAARGQKIEYCGQSEQKNLLKTRSAWDMAIKCASVTRLYGGTGGVVFLTATPVNNSPLELYNLVQMIAPALWEDHGVRDKEQFIDRYWDIQPVEVVKPNGEQVTAPGLVGIKAQNREELLAILGPIFDRKTTRDLVMAGWIRAVPDTVAEQVPVGRDPAQYVLLKNLTALLVSFTEKSDEQKERMAERGQVDKGVLTEEEKREASRMWRLDGDTPVKSGYAPEWSEAFGKELEKTRKNVSIFRLIWMGMLDKVAMDPRLLASIRPEINEKMEKAAKKRAAYLAWEEKVKAGDKTAAKKAPSAGNPTDWLLWEINLKILDLLKVEDVLAYYDQKGREFCPKVRKMAEFIRDNLERENKGACAHVIFCDWKEMFPQIEEALHKIAKIPKKEIGRITGGKGGTPISKRLAISRALNGFDAWGNPIKPTLRVVIGTSDAMAEGIDLQKRTCAVHHLTMPWVPSMVHQRNGRAVRQGNDMGKVDLLYYLTEHSYDVMRFDKVTAKAGWLDTLFKGLQDTGNPAVGSKLSVQEMILSLVIEDPETLQERLAILEAAREKDRRAKLISQVESEWLKINSYFQSARKHPDSATRSTLEYQARQRLERLHKFVWPIPEEARIRVVDEVVYYDPATEDVIAPGAFVLAREGIYKVLRHEVRGTTWLHWVRSRGSIREDAVLEIEPRDAKGEKPKGWTDEESLDYLLRQVRAAPSSLAIGDLAQDLQPHAAQFWEAFRASGNPSATTFDWFLQLPAASPQAVLLPVAYPPEGRGPTYGLSKLIGALSNQTHAFVPHTMPRAFELWCTAVQTGMLYVGVPEGNQYRPDVRMPDRPFKGTSQTDDERVVRRLTQQVFNRSLPGEVWKLRQALLWG